MHPIYPPNTEAFKQLEQYTTFNMEEWKAGRYINTYNQYFVDSKGIPEEYTRWVKVNWEYLKYIYFKNLLTMDGIYATITFDTYCKEAYTVFKHNLYLEKFDNVADEISKLVGET